MDKIQRIITLRHDIDNLISKPHTFQNLVDLIRKETRIAFMENSESKYYINLNAMLDKYTDMHRRRKSEKQKEDVKEQLSREIDFFLSHPL